MKRSIHAVVVGGAVFTTVAGAAATLGLTSPSLGAASASVTSCDPDGVATSYNTTYDATDSRYEVPSVAVTGIASPACTGRTVAVTLTQGTTNLGSGTATISGTTATVTIAASPSASSIDGLSLSIG